MNANKSHIKKVEYLNIDEIKKLIAACTQNLDPRYMSEYIILTAILTGARFGEIAALKWSDIDFKNKTISITKSWNRKYQEIGPPKTHSSVRTITVPDILLKDLSQLKDNGYEFVFGTNIGKHLPPGHGTVNTTLKSIMKDAGIYKQGFHFHSLRHSHVAYLLAHKVDIYAISKRLGHSNVSTTLGVYAYMIDEFENKENKKIIDSLNQLSKNTRGLNVIY